MRETGRSGCPINLAVEIIGDRWSLLILRDMIFAGKRSYNQLLDGDERIATNILRDRLNYLVKHGLLKKSPDPDQPRRKNYRLTARSISLVPLLVHLGFWGQQWLPASPKLRRRAKELFAGGPALWDEIMAGLREDRASRAAGDGAR
jgi:DNA-binding HxlR family transcriptional regulator